MSTNQIQNVAIIGGTGQVGSRILSSLLTVKRFNITAVSRSDSQAAFPENVKVVKGDYNSDTFLEQALVGIEALIITLAVTAPKDLEKRIIDAAIKAGVTWIIPNGFVSDGAHPHMGGKITVNAHKAVLRRQIEQSGNGKTKWISIVNGPWYDFSLKNLAFSIDPVNRKATLYDDGKVKFNTTTWHMVGAGVAALLSLPVSGHSPTLSDYANKFVYLSSFHIGQRDILDAAQAATGTTEKDWTIEQKDAQSYTDDGFAKMSRGDISGIVPMIYGSHFIEGLGGSYEGKKQTLNNVVGGLPKEDIVEVTKRLIAEMEATKSSAS
ncbi:uncharacterized protein AB675_536 [Cyphellophora attinorum]|uniref:NmrA-like domain-containing protein n=1 Tax=Cyphellophora attinorum TaxID=1664694 RepID=A0A0N0NRT0_9EURO|nr:uncharacterized protein AB675_536 [Phialophora attinorum]KPI45451.1 hypothetical protein AB675_536 [Phialophora attinorum]